TARVEVGRLEFADADNVVAGRPVDVVAVDIKLGREPVDVAQLLLLGERRRENVRVEDADITDRGTRADKIRCCRRGGDVVVRVIDRTAGRRRDDAVRLPGRGDVATDVGRFLLAGVRGDC